MLAGRATYFWHLAFLKANSNSDLHTDVREENNSDDSIQDIDSRANDQCSAFTGKEILNGHLTKGI